MACANRNQQPSSIVEDLNSLSLFGKCQPDDLIFRTQEEEAKKQKFIQEQMEREKEIRRQTKIKDKQDIEYRKFLKESQKKELRGRNGISHNSPSKTRGRGSLLNGAVNYDFGRTMPRPRGRGRLSPQELECLPLFDREHNVQKNLMQFSESSLYKNAVQKSFWVEKGSNKEEVEYDRCTPDTDSNTNYTDSSSTSDNYEDAESFSQTSSPHSFSSAPSRSSFSPLTAASPGLEPQSRPEVASYSPPPRKPRGNRLAARFSNNIGGEEEEEGNKETPHVPIQQKRTPEEESVVASGVRPQQTVADCDDPLAILGSSRPPSVPVKFWKSYRNSGTSFNSLNPSQRVLSNNVLQPAMLCYAAAGESSKFTLNMDDFPSL